MIKANGDIVQIVGNGQVIVEELNNIIGSVLKNSPETMLGVLTGWSSELEKASDNMKDEPFFNKVAIYSIKHNRETFGINL